MTPDADRTTRLVAQREFRRPLVVRAGAGTGKTTLLVARIVAWSVGPGWEAALSAETDRLAATQPSVAPDSDRVAVRVLEGIVAITFTEAAASEMATKVARAYSTLAAGNLPLGVEVEALTTDLETAARRAAALLVALDRLVVGTIHSFCKRLLSRHPFEAGVHPAMVVDPEGEILGEVIHETLSGALGEGFSGAGDPDLLALAAAGYGPEQLGECVDTLARQGVTSDDLAVDPFGPDAIARLWRRCREAVEAFLSAGGHRLCATTRGTVAVEVLAMLQDTLTELKVQPANLEHLETRLGRIREVWASDRLTNLRAWQRKGFSKAESTALGDAEAAVRQTLPGLAATIDLLVRLEPVLLSHARRVVLRLRQSVEVEMTRRGALLFEDLLRLARDLVEQHPEVAAAEREGTAQILVDEFQDTDAMQCAVLRSLVLQGPEAGRPGLFLVGDPQQSIYGWRGADLAEFEGFVGDVLAAGGLQHNLVVNRRSVPAILAEVTRVVEPIMQRAPGLQPAFEPLTVDPARASDPGFVAGSHAPVEIIVDWGYEGGEPKELALSEATRLEADAFAAAMRSLHDEQRTAWKDIALLLRASGDMDEYIRALREAGVPYVVERDRSYFRRREVVEAAALVRAVLDPTDHLALVTVLRSPLAGVPDAALVPLWSHGLPRLCTDLSGPNDPALVQACAALGKVAAELPPEIPGIDRIPGWEHAAAHTLTALAELRHTAAHQDVGTFLERLRVTTLAEATAAARTLGAYRLANLQRFFRRLEEALEAASGDMQTVLRLLRTAVGEGRDAEEGRPSLAEGDAVRLMTIHKAKGLDFEHVFIGQVHRGRGNQGPGVCACERRDGRIEYLLLGVPTPGWTEVEARREAVSDAESVRLLYVALTRAKSHLVIGGAWPRNKVARTGSQLELVIRAGHPPEDAGAAFEAAHNAGGHGTVVSGTRYVFPALAPEAEPRPATSVRPAPLDAVALRGESARLSTLRAQAQARMTRPVSAPVSAEAHEMLAREIEGEDDPEASPHPARRPGREPGDAQAVAVAVGTVIHHVLEVVEPAAGTAAMAEAGAALLAELAPRHAPAARVAEVSARTTALWRLFVTGPLARRLVEVAPYIVARELPVVLPPPASQDGPVGFVSGAVDLLYGDPESGELVVADYKTDAVSGTDITVRTATYAPQLDAYAAAVQGALGLATRPRREIWFLAANRIVRPD